MGLYSTNQGLSLSWNPVEAFKDNMKGVISSGMDSSYTSDYADSTEPVGDTYRGIGADWFNQKNIAKEDFKRAEQAADNQLKRDLYLFEQNKAFSREQMDWQERMANSSYQRAVEDMKRAGINPVMAINQGGAATPSVPSAGSSRSSSGYRNADGVNTTGLVASIISLIAGVYGTAAKNATSLAIAQLNSQSRENTSAFAQTEKLYRDQQWRNWYDNNRR